MNKKGFTLIEVIIVIVILGVLATLALPRIAGNVEASRAAEVMNMFGALRRAALDCYDMTQDMNACRTQLQLGVTIPPVASGASFSYTSEAAPAAAGPIQFTADRGGSQICLNLEVSGANAGRGQYSLAGANNPYTATITRTGAMGGAACVVGAAM